MDLLNLSMGIELKDVILLVLGAILGVAGGEGILYFKNLRKKNENLRKINIEGTYIQIITGRNIGKYSLIKVEYDRDRGKFWIKGKNIDENWGVSTAFETRESYINSELDIFLYMYYADAGNQSGYYGLGALNLIDRAGCRVAERGSFVSIDFDGSLRKYQLVNVTNEIEYGAVDDIVKMKNIIIARKI